jgi:hypothetical protein
LVIGDIGTYDVWLTDRATDALRGDIAIKGGLTTMLKRQAPKPWRPSNKHLVSEFELAAPLRAVRL